MKLEDQVCSLENAKRLKELGVGQHKSYFSWHEDEYKNYEVSRGRLIGRLSNWVCDAFTAAELGKMLPKQILSKNILYYFRQYEDDIYYEAEMDYNTYKSLVLIEGINTMSEADARALMLIYLLENKLLPASVDEGEIKHETD